MIRRWLGAYRIKQWEKQMVKTAWRRLEGRKHSLGTGRFVSGLLAASMLFGSMGGTGLPAFLNAHGFRLVSRDQSCHVEWTASPDTEGKAEDIYGIRFSTERMELQFYHETGEIAAAAQVP